MLKKIVLAVFLASVSVVAHANAPQEKNAGHGRHDMNKMWAEMRSRPVGMAVSIAADEKGVLWLAQMRAGHVFVSHSEDGGKHFSDAVAVNAITESILAEGQNRPQIVVRNGVIAVAWSQALPKTFAGNIRFSHSVDGGKTFSAPVTINDENDDVGHSFAALTISDGGNITLAWLDGRDKAEAKKVGKEYEGSAIYYAISQDGGVSFSKNKKLVDHTCECCRVGITTDFNGVAVVFWRQLFDGGVRDFSVANMDEYPSVVRASEDQWQIKACPHHGGDIAADTKGSLHLVWFTGSSQKAGLFYRRIDDEHMTVPHAFGNVDAQAGYPAVFAHDKSVYLAWREFDGKKYQLMVSQSSDRGDQWGKARVVAAVNGKADIPEFVVNAQGALLVWNSEAEGLRIFNLTSNQ